MSRRKSNGKNIHTNSLMPSTVDEVSLCQKVEDGFLTVCGIYLKQTGDELPIPTSLNGDFLRWRNLAVRYKNGDLRHSESEYESLKTIAQWTISVNCKLRNQPDKKVVWK